MVDLGHLLIVNRTVSHHSRRESRYGSLKILTVAVVGLVLIGTFLR